MTHKDINEHTKTSLSALFDGEANELEMRRLLSQADNNPEITDTWRRYSAIRSVLRDEPVGGVDLSRHVRAALENDHDSAPITEQPMTEPSDAVERAHVETPKHSGVWRLLSSGAIAASVALAVLFGARVLLDNPTSQPAVAKQTPLALPSSEPLVNEEDIAFSDEQMLEAQRKLQSYVLQHAESSAVSSERTMMPFARAARFDSSTSSPSQ